ncbi:MAG: c-type cytochrome, partial [Nitrospirota bacterium]|nr:c-type cytochrome [Nitrospirota bacterium]
RCAGCHGMTGVEGPSPRLVGGQRTLSTHHAMKTIGSYWPYATTMFDYIYRAMPYPAPQSLTSSQVYAVVAWLLYRNGVIAENMVVNKRTLPAIRMPNRKGFVSDPRPDIELVQVGSNRQSDLGDIEFPTSGSPDAQRHFLRGVLLLHNFEYDDAAAAFRQAQENAPDFAMAYWGEAMTYNHPLWGEQDLKAAREVLARLGPTTESRQATVPTAREQAYLEAIERLYGDGDKKTRDQAYEAAMGAMAVEYPTDLEAKAFYALAILGSRQGGRDGLTYLKAGSIAELVYHQNPRHPGAVHYMIHAYDDPQHAFQGLEAARIYSDLASAAPHAQHMPSHIFMALGMWAEVVTANEVAWKASEERIRRKELGVGNRSYHVLNWLMYGYLQQGRYADAKKLLDIVTEDARSSGSRHIQGYRASMRAMYMIESQAWDAKGVEKDRSTIRPSAAISELFSIGLSAVHTQDFATARRALGSIRDRMAEESADNLSAKMRSAMVVAKELDAMILLADNKTNQGLSLLKEAATLQDSLPFEYGPPFPAKPSHELLGEVLLSVGRIEAARHHFEEALIRAPQRALSLKGLAQAHQ